MSPTRSPTWPPPAPGTSAERWSRSTASWAWGTEPHLFDHERKARQMALLDGKKILVTGVLMESSIAFTVARLAQERSEERRVGKECGPRVGGMDRRETVRNEVLRWELHGTRRR